MPDYIPSPIAWVREQVERYEASGGTEATTLRDTGYPVIIVTHVGHVSGAVRKTPLMRVKDGANYVLVGSVGGAPKDPKWVGNLRASPSVQIRDRTEVMPMTVREVPRGDVLVEVDGLRETPAEIAGMVRRPGRPPVQEFIVSAGKY